MFFFFINMHTILKLVYFFTRFTIFTKKLLVLEQLMYSPIVSLFR